MRRPDQGGRRCAKGELALKFVVNVNVARVVKMLWEHMLVAVTKIHLIWAFGELDD